MYDDTREKRKTKAMLQGKFQGSGLIMRRRRFVVTADATRKAKAKVFLLSFILYIQCVALILSPPSFPSSFSSTPSYLLFYYCRQYFSPFCFIEETKKQKQKQKNK